jgi:uncharacterized integral membrane protein
MIRFLKMLVLLPVAVLVVLFAVANRDAITLSFDPVSPAPVFSAVLPLYAVVFLAVALGMLIGGGAAWLAQGRYRRGHRRERREADRLRAESERLREAVARARDGGGAPALPAPRA